MNVSSAYQPKETYNSTTPAKKTDNKTFGSITTEMLLESIRKLGVASVHINKADNYILGFKPPEYNKLGVHVTIDPSMLQPLKEDPIFREQQFDIIRHNVSITVPAGFIPTSNRSTIYIPGSWVCPFIDGLLGVMLHVRISAITGTANKFCLSNFMPSEIEDETKDPNTETYPPETKKENQTSYDLPINLYEKFSARFIEKRGQLLAQQNEMYFLQKSASDNDK